MAKRHAHVKAKTPAQYDMGEFSVIPRAGHNVVVLLGSTPEEQERREGLIRRLDAYERSFADQYRQYPGPSESVAHANALYDSGLTGEGLINARGFAGKKCSAKPGIFYPNA